MTREPHPIAAEQLLANAGWVRALARSLVDAHDADDVVQATWLAAIEHAGADAARPVELKRWLATIARHVALKLLRSRERSHRRELVAARSEAQASAREVVERAALHRELVDAVMALAEPYRATVLMRFFDDLPPRTIARQLGISSDVVRKRLSRALAMLRAQLDRDSAERGSWCATLLTLASKGVLMSAKVKLAVAAAVIVLTGASLMLLLERPPVDAPPPSAVVREDVATGEVAPVPIVTRTEVTEAQHRAGDEPARKTGYVADQKSMDSNAPPPPKIVFAGRVIDGVSGAPLPGVAITLGYRFFAQQADLEKELGHAWPSLPDAIDGGQEIVAPSRSHTLVWSDKTAGGKEHQYFSLEEYPLGETDGAGQFHLELWKQITTGLCFRQNGYAPRVVWHDEIADGKEAELEIKLFPLGDLVVRVMDAVNHPAPGFRVRVRALEAGKLASRSLVGVRWRDLGVSDVQGECRAQDLPAGVALTAMAERGGYVRRQSGSIDAASRTGVIEIEVRSAGAVRGRVLRADQSPAAGVQVYFRCDATPAWTPTTTALDGSFVLENAAAGEGQLRVFCMQSVVVHETPATVVVNETLDVGTIVLPERVRLSGRLVASQPMDFSRFTVWAYRDTDQKLLGWGRSDPSGSFALEVLAGRASLVVKAVDLEVARVAATAPAENLEIAITSMLGAIQGLLPETIGVDKLIVVLYAKDEQARYRRWRWSHEFTAAELHDRRLQCTAVAPGQYALHVLAGPDMGCAWLPGIVVTSGAATDVGAIAIGFGTISGIVVTSEGAPVPGAKVQARNSTGWDLQAVADASGSFALDRAPPGDWSVQADDLSGVPSPPVETEVVIGAKAQVRLQMDAPARVHGVVMRAKQPQFAVELSLVVEGNSARTMPAVTDEHGEFAFDRLLAGEYQLRVERSGPGTAALRIVPLMLKPGEDREVTLDLDQNPVRVHVTGAAPLDLASPYVISLDAKSANFGERRLGKSTGDGWVTVDLFPGLVLLQAGRVNALFDATGAGSTLEVTAARACLELELSPDARRRPAPELRLVRINDVNVERAAFTVPWRRVAAAPVRYASIPLGARVRLEGSGADGSPIVRELDIDAETVRATWP